MEAGAVHGDGIRPQASSHAPQVEALQRASLRVGDQGLAHRPAGRGDPRADAEAVQEHHGVGAEGDPGAGRAEGRGPLEDGRREPPPPQGQREREPPDAGAHDHDPQRGGRGAASGRGVRAHRRTAVAPGEEPALGASGRHPRRATATVKTPMASVSSSVVGVLLSRRGRVRFGPRAGGHRRAAASRRGPRLGGPAGGRLLGGRAPWRRSGGRTRGSPGSRRGGSGTRLGARAGAPRPGSRRRARPAPCRRARPMPARARPSLPERPGRRRTAVATSRRPTRDAAATKNHPDGRTPCSRANQPRASEKGRKSIQERVPTPEATPALTADGTPSWSSRPAWMPTIADDRASTAWAPITAPSAPLHGRASAAAGPRSARVSTAARRSRPSLLAR